MFCLRIFALLTLLFQPLVSTSRSLAAKHESASSTEAKNWESDAFFEQFMRDISSEYPELAAANGLPEFWGTSSNLKIEHFQQLLEKLKSWVLKTAEFQAKSSNNDAKLDLELFLMNLKNWIEGLERLLDPLQIDLISPSTFIKNSLLPYAHDKNDSEKLRALFMKLSVGNASSFSAYDFLENELRQKMARTAPSKLNFPSKERIETLLSIQSSEIEYVKNLLGAQRNSAEVNKALERVEEDRKGWESYVRGQVLKAAKSTPNNLRSELVTNLRTHGIFYTPEQIVQFTKEDLQKLTIALEASRAELASKHSEFKGLSTKDLFFKLSHKRFLTQKAYLQDLNLSLSLLKKFFPELAQTNPSYSQLKFEKLPNSVVQLDLETLEVAALGKKSKSESPTVLLPQIQVMNRQNQDFLFDKASFIAVAREVFPGKYFLIRNVQNTSTSMIRKNYMSRLAYYQGWGLLALQAADNKLNSEQRFLMNLYLLYKTQVAHFDAARVLRPTDSKELQDELVNKLGLSGATFIHVLKAMEATPGTMSVDYAGWRLFTESNVSLQPCSAKHFLTQPLYPLIPGKRISKPAQCP